VELSFEIVCSKRCKNNHVKELRTKNATPVPVTPSKRFWYKDAKTETPEVTSISLLLAWLTEEGNYSTWRGGNAHSGLTKKEFAVNIAQMINDKVAVKRDFKDIQNKIEALESSFRSATDWLNARGAGVTSESNIKEYVCKLCIYFYDFEPIMSSRASTAPLFSSGVFSLNSSSPISAVSKNTKQKSFSLSSSEDESILENEDPNQNIEDSTRNTPQKVSKPTSKRIHSISSHMESKQKRLKKIDEDNFENAIIQMKKDSIKAEREKLEKEYEWRRNQELRDEKNSLRDDKIAEVKFRKWKIKSN
jgi:hypothetical protein